ncbi:MAG: glycosyltransferase [Anaerolineae bacterium]|nr:glycosyltransferase [Anaerolineae bacterium]
MTISLITTVLNEGQSLIPLLDSIAAQTQKPDEIVVCDGGSTDDTLDILKRYTQSLPLTVFQRPGANISQGRNAAIEAAAHEIIAVTDAGVCLEPAWLETIVAPLEDNPTIQTVAGFFHSDPQTPFEVALGATTLPELRDIDPATFMPSSRSVAFRRAAWKTVGGYPEWLDFCEDLIFDFRLAERVGSFAFAPQAIARFRPRRSLRAFYRQYRYYARGDGKANLFFRRHLIRYLTYFGALPFALLAGICISRWWWSALLAGGMYMIAVPYRRLFNQWGDLTPGGKLIAALWVPIIRVVGDIAKMVGYPAGLAWRAHHHPPDWRKMDSAHG